MNHLLGLYYNGGYRVSLYSDGTKVRERIADEPPMLPEQIDLKITDWCDGGCAWCHEGSTARGQHAELALVRSLRLQLPRGAEVAIGGGDPVSNYAVETFAADMSNAGIVVNLTVNALHLERSKAVLERMASRGHLHGLGISLHPGVIVPEWALDYQHAVVHAVAGVTDPHALLEVRRMKILVLGYKRHGRGWQQALPEGVAVWRRLLPLLARRHHLSFDNLAIEQLEPQRLLEDPSAFRRMYMGHEGEFSMYIDAVKGEYSVSSYSPFRAAWDGDLAAAFASVRQVAGHA